MAEIADQDAVRKVRKALKAAGLDNRVVGLDQPLRDADAAAKALGVDAGAIVRTRMFAIGQRMVLVLHAADHKIVKAALAPAFFLAGDVREPTAGEIRGLTGFSAATLPPVGFNHRLPTVIDRSLKRFRHVYACAGDASAVFRTSVDDLKRLTAGIVSWNVAQPLKGPPEQPRPKRLKTFSGGRDVPGPDVPPGTPAEGA